MKTKTFIFVSLIALICSGLFFSCNVPVGLGSKLDVDGPVVEFTAPEPRKAMQRNLTIEGTASDHSGIDRLLVKATIDREPFEKEWRWNKGSWQIYENKMWSDYPAAQWIGTEKTGVWSIPIDMGNDAEDGEYVFSVQAWDLGDFTDDNSFKTRVLIIDKHPPSVEVSNPYLYSRFASKYDNGQWQWKPADPEFPDYEEITRLDGIDNDDEYRFNPASIGKFVTQEFELQWQIIDEHDIGSIDLRLYDYKDNDVDNDPLTPLPDTHIYRYSENLPPADPESDVKPNGKITVPDLTKTAGTYNGGELANPIDEKTTIRVVAICYDRAGNLSQEKTLGYFVYWPLADKPWITFNGNMANLLVNNDPRLTGNKDDLNDTLFMIYPSKPIKATAFHAHGVKKVTYSLYKVKEAGDDLTGELEPATDRAGSMVNREIPNPPRSGTTYSNIFPWEFIPPPRSGYYVLVAMAYGLKDQESIEYKTMFRVQDITFPDFPTSPNPVATEPLFKFIGRREAPDRPDTVPPNHIRISGTVSDATHVDTLTMVWINPKSRNFAAMSQLAYFRNDKYAGWQEALLLDPTNATMTETPDFAPDYPYDPTAPNRLWNLELEEEPEVDYDTGRHVFKYSVDINLDDLKIGPDIGPEIDPALRQQPLSSQVFLLRAENPDHKCTILTYAPKGDTLAPTIGITDVKIWRGGDEEKEETYYPSISSEIPKIVENDIIIVNGTWSDDSAEYLPIAGYFTDNLKVDINGQKLGSVQVEQTDITSGTWARTVTVVGVNQPGEISEDKLRDTLVVSAEARDIGGNRSEVQRSWLIESDNLRLTRISSDAQDGTYNKGKTIRIFLEFNKAVQLSNQGSLPTLILNTGTAVYDSTYHAKPANEGGVGAINTRQYFTYTVGENDSTGNSWLNVTGINADGWEDDFYPFTWHRGIKDSETYEEIRVTNIGAHDGGKPGSHGFYAKKIPTNPNDLDDEEFPYTLIAGKNIKIDTTPPTVTGIRSSNRAGYYGTDSDIYVTVEFSKSVKIGTTTPRLELEVSTYSGSSQTKQTVLTNVSPVQVNDDKITFVYTVQDGNLAVGTGVVVKDYEGEITDLAGTALAGNAISSIPLLTSQTPDVDRTLTGVHVDTIKPVPPTIRLTNSQKAPTTNADALVNGGIPAISGNSDIDLKTVYEDVLHLAIEGSSYNVGGIEGETVGILEYSKDGENWGKADNIINKSWSAFSQLGPCTIFARQTDLAGNTSDPTKSITFNWDKGSLVSRISSGAANGTYTHIAGRESIPITVYFRKNVNITASSGIRLNALEGAGNGTEIEVTAINVSLPVSGVNSLTFNYTVENGDRMPAGVNWLDVTGIIGITATDTTGVNVSSYFSLPVSGSDLRLGENKEIKVETGNLTRASISFEDGAGDGVRPDDGSYWTTLEIKFNHDINKGSGNITIEQIVGSGNTAYRLPAVLTESQYNRFRGIANFNDYYTKGTNGYIYDTVTPANSRADTSTKYVLGYAYDTSVAANQPIAGDGGTVIQQFADTFRKAEGISINVNSAAVTKDGNTLKIRLTGSNAPQVPGATYAVKYPAGLVNDSLGNESKASDDVSTETNMNNVPAVNVTLGGVARPFVRIKRTQDTIGARNTANLATTPTLVATQPTTATVRMDSRTPNSTILYTASTATYVASNRNWNIADGPDPNALAGNTTINPSGGITRPTTTSTTYSTPGSPGTPITIGNANHGGFKWWVLARARTGAGTTPSPYVYSDYSDEIAYRTAITYRLRGTGNNGVQIQTTTTGQQRLVDGDQIWIRGGDSIGSSTIPGFPFTWEDNFSALAGKRAGIRLMTKVAATTQTAGGTGADNTINNLNNSQWQFQTWDINATAYIGFFLGRDAGMNGANKPTVGTTGGTTVEYTPSSSNEAWQYGPRWFTAQRGGWTSLRTQYRVIPGEHRWIDVGEEITGTEYINFPTGFNGRPDAMAPSANANTANW